MSGSMRLCALCAVGLERVVGNELKRLGLSLRGLEGRPGMVFFDADAAGMVRCHLELRCAERILLIMGQFRTLDFDDFYAGVRAIAWESLVERESRVVIEKVRLGASRHRSATSLQAMAQKAIYERLCAHYGLRRMPESGLSQSLRIYVDRDEALLGLDLSGESLQRRGYRRSNGPAPLKETIAAALVIGSGWKRRLPLLDPCCGTGTLCLEALMYGLDLAPGLGRNFAFRGMRAFDDGLFQAIRADCAQRPEAGRQLCIMGSDIEPAMVEASRRNLAELAKIVAKAGRQDLAQDGFASSVSFERLDLVQAKAPEGMGQGCLICNPPYGDRLLSPEEARALYSRMAALRAGFPAWSMTLITTDREFPKYFGQAADGLREIQNGQERILSYQYQELHA